MHKNKPKEDKSSQVLKGKLEESEMDKQAENVIAETDYRDKRWNGRISTTQTNNATRQTKLKRRRKETKKLINEQEKKEQTEAAHDDKRRDQRTSPNQTKAEASNLKAINQAKGEEETKKHDEKMNSKIENMEDETACKRKI